MVIEDIRLDTERLRSKEEKKKEEKAKKKYTELIKDFNSEAEKINCCFRIRFYGKYPSLYTRKKSFIFTDEKEYNTIFYYDDWGMENNKEIFTFYSGLDCNVFKIIEPILNKIEQKFEIRLKNGEVPAKYGIIQELEQK